MSRCSGLFRDMALAYAFGTEPLFSLFLVAFRFSHLFRRLIGETALQNTFVPLYEEFRKDNPAKAFQFFKNLNSTAVLSLSGLIGMATLILAFIPFPDQKLQELATFTQWMLPSLLFIALFGINSAYLACEKHYFTIGAAPIAFNLIFALSALSLAAFPLNFAIYGMCIAVTLACAAQWLVTYPKSSKYFTLSIFGSKPFSADVKRLFKPLLLANIAIAASQINSALDSLFALYANSEGPAWLWYAIRVQQLPLALFGIALANALMPPIVRAIKNEDKAAFHRFFHFATKRLVALTVPITFAIIATAPSCINLLFGRGQFDLEAVMGTAKCLIAYGIGLLPAAYVIIAAPTFNAQSDYKTPLNAAWLSMALNVFLNTLLIFGLGYGAVSVALATSFSAFFNAFYLHKRLPDGLQTTEVGHWIAVFSTALLALAALFFVDWIYLGYIPTLMLLNGSIPHLSQDLASEVTIFSLEAVVFVLVWTLAARYFKVEGLWDWLHKG